MLQADGDAILRYYLNGAFQATYFTASAAVSNGDDLALVLDGESAELFVNGTSVGSGSSVALGTNTTWTVSQSGGANDDSVELSPLQLKAIDKLYELGSKHGFYDTLIKAEEYLIPREYTALRES